MKKFQIGDRVQAIGKVAGLNLSGKIGTIIYVYEKGKSWDILVEFDNEFEEGHDGGGRGKSRHCRYGYEKEFELYDERVYPDVSADEFFKVLAI